MIRFFRALFHLLAVVTAWTGLPQLLSYFLPTRLRRNNGWSNQESAACAMPGSDLMSSMKARKTREAMKYCEDHLQEYTSHRKLMVKERQEGDLEMDESTGNFLEERIIQQGQENGSIGENPRRGRLRSQKGKNRDKHSSSESRSYPSRRRQTMSSSSSANEEGGKQKGGHYLRSCHREN